jgi:hypothetical protein
MSAAPIARLGTSWSGLSTPSRRAIAATWPMPICWPSRAVATL